MVDRRAHMADFTAQRTVNRAWTRCLATLCLAVLPALATPPSQGLASQPKSVLTGSDDFDRTDLLDPEYKGNSVAGFSFLNPNRFSMRQSYSVGMSSGSFG